MVDAHFQHPRLAAIYDALDPDRGDLEVYLDLVHEVGAHRVLDVGCGTGTFALLLASHDVEVIAVDPASGSLEVARAKPGADRVRWLYGDATSLPPMQVDLATMTGNVAQAIVAPQTLRFREQDEIEAALAAHGYTLDEVRDAPDRPGREFVFVARRQPDDRPANALG